MTLLRGEFSGADESRQRQRSRINGAEILLKSGPEPAHTQWRFRVCRETFMAARTRVYLRGTRPEFRSDL